MTYGLTRSGTGCMLCSCTHMATVGVRGLMDNMYVQRKLQTETSVLSSFSRVRSSNSSDDVSRMVLSVWIMCDANMTSFSAIRISEQQL